MLIWAAVAAKGSRLRGTSSRAGEWAGFFLPPRVSWHGAWDWGGQVPATCSTILFGSSPHCALATATPQPTPLLDVCVLAILAVRLCVVGAQAGNWDLAPSFIRLRERHMDMTSPQSYAEWDEEQMAEELQAAAAFGSSDSYAQRRLGYRRLVGRCAHIQPAALSRFYLPDAPVCFLQGVVFIGTIIGHAVRSCAAEQALLDQQQTSFCRHPSHPLLLASST